MPFRDYIVVRIISGIAAKIWVASLAAMLTCLMVYFFYGTLTAFALLSLAVLCVFYHAQDSLLYHPEIPAQSRIFVPLPSMHGLPYDAVNIRSADNVSLHAYWIRHNGEKGMFVPTVVYFHGNAGNMGHRLHNASGIFHTLQCNILMVEYRGYGLSTGNASERGLCADARAAIDYLFTRHDLDLNQIVIFGRSLGGAVAIDLAANTEYSQRIMCVILENTFTSIPDMAVELIHRYVKYLPLFCFKNKFLSLQKIQHFSAPCLFVSGMADTLVPPRMMSQLHVRCGSIRKQILQINGGTHNDTWAMTGYYHGIQLFLAECKETRGPLQVPPVMTKNNWPQIEEV